ncbi:MAG: 3-hydroxyacyl-CoA dehydrogenase family protein [Actinomycetota bacterium]|jgi:3-hydroxybutyryl-CoA dehydrogenase|nr:3-hydroxyacyl-CoA dehydrogenase family protein [Actinomycetota bacterium]
MYPERVVVVGGGTMGAGIAQSFATVGSTVTVVEASQDAAAAARDRLSTSLAKALQRGKIDSAAAVLGRINVRTGALPSDAELYVEAVPEDIDMKLDVLQRVSSAAGAETIMATNTSSLPITELAAAVPNPGRFLGMHFFNPVPASVLVELIRHDGTTDAVIERAGEWISALGKESIVVRDTPGFATSRLGVAVGLEAIRMLEEGVGSAEDIDTAMRLGYRWPMGPLRLTDLVGLDVRLGIAEHLTATLGDRFSPPNLLRDKVARGELGAKTGRGFFDWSDGRGQAS